jgi:tRNA threonylcarbamoyladenosine biosynthesis protein TsaE
MSPEPFAHLTLTDEDSTRAFGACLAAVLRPGDAILLVGEIGAGKSVLSRAVIQARLAALGRIEDVPSPTFTLVQTYDLETCELWHCDLYRLRDPQEIDALGLAEAWTTGIVLIEWPDRLGADVPPGALVIALRATGPEDTSRNMRLTDLGGDWVARLAPCLDRAA